MHKGAKRASHKRTIAFPPTECLAVVEDVLFGKTNKLASRVMTLRAVKKTVRAVRANKSLPTFRTLRNAVCAARSSFGPRHVWKDRHVLALCISKAIIAYMNRHPCSMTSTLEVAICTWLTMMSTGIAKDGITVVPKNEFVSQHIPHPSLMSLVPRVQCRAISVSIRQFKCHVFTRNGGVIHSRIFNNGVPVK